MFDSTVTIKTNKKRLQLIIPCVITISQSHLLLALNYNSLAVLPIKMAKGKKIPDCHKVLCSRPVLFFSRTKDFSS